MAVDDPIDPSGVLAELTRTVLSDRETGSVLNDVVTLVKRRVRGADEASITLIRNKRASTVVATGELAVVLDEIQYDEGYGPCLSAARANEPMSIDDAAMEQRWPDYIRAAVGHGLGSSLSMPLPVEHFLVGALNIYSRRPRAFGPESAALADALASHVTALLGFADTAEGHRQRAAGLTRALRSRGVIDQAKGIIMATRRCTADEAFQQLRDVSMAQNVKLVDIATSLVASASGHPVRPEDPGSD